MKPLLPVTMTVVFLSGITHRTTTQEAYLRRGRAVVIALVESDARADACRAILLREGAETVDAARALWGVGLTEVPGTDRDAVRDRARPGGTTVA
jgi:hypothetical protein